jgi:uncharacterized small protein (DUF1192 family)
VSTYRERRAARAERLRGWAEKREAKAAAELEAARKMSDAIPMGQPILIGHHSEKRDRNYRGRISRTFERSFENGNKAREMSSRAAEIDRQAAGAIYSDDVDAVDRLRERIAELEHERTRWKAYNAACKKAGESTAAALEFLDPAQRESVASQARIGWLRPDGGIRSMSNLTANIGRNRKRLSAILESQSAEQQWRAEQ